MVAVLGGNSRMIMEKDMEHGRVLVETDTLDNTVMIRNMGMEYTDGVMGQYIKEMYITESGKMVTEMVKVITGGQMEMNIGENSRIARDGEKESHKKEQYSTKTHMKKETASTGVNCQKLLTFND
jgi:hypothetical protein